MKNIDIFKISVYQNLLRNYKYNLRNLDKNLNIYEKMDGYYSKDEIKYIFKLLIYQLDNIIESKIFKEFVPLKIQKEINNLKFPINKFFCEENYKQIINNYNKIFSMININLNKE